MIKAMSTSRHASYRPRRFSRWLSAICMAVVLTLGAPGTASAQEDDADKIVDARLESYSKSVTVGGSTALMWVLLLVLGIVCVGPLFMNSKRTHLD